MSGYEAHDVARAKLAQVFRFLQSLHQLRNPVQREITDQPWFLWFHDLPHHPSVQRGTISGVGQDESEDELSERSGEGKGGVSSGDDFLLKVSKPRLTDPPEPPQELIPWLQSGWQSIDGSVNVLPTIDDPSGQTDASGQRLTIRFDDDPRRPALLAQWVERRAAWVEAERPARKAMSLYERLRTLYAQMERESERLELMVGDGLLTWQHPGGQYLHHPVLLLRLQLHYTPNIPEFTLVEAEHPPELYTTLFRALLDVSASAIAQARQDVEQGGWHPLGGKETDNFLRRLVNHLSPHGVFAGEGATRESRQAPTITRDPVLFLRTRTLGFNTALEAILEDLAQREKLPYSLTSIVGIAGEETRQQTAPPPSLLDSPNGEDEEVLLSKPANAEQVEIARRLERYGAVLVQGPPGTGKTHTIANLLGHLLAQGKSVLVTSHTAKALRVLREQVVEPLQPLCVSVLDESSKQMVPLDGPDASQLGAEPERTCVQFVPFIRQRLDWYPTVWAPLEQALMQQGFNMAAFLAETPINLAEHGELLRLRDAVLQRLPAVLAAENNRRLATSQEAHFSELRRKLELSGGKAAKADVVQGLQAAVEGYNPMIYRAAFEGLADLHARREVLQRRQALLVKLEQVAPAWATAIRDRSGRHGERDLPGKPEDAWLWRQLSDELDRRSKTSLEDLQQQIAQLSTQLQHTTALLVEQQAWAAQVRRTTLDQRQALMGWKQKMQRIGKGTGKRVPRLLAEARKDMLLCQSAVPVWIMPLSRVVENFDPRRNRFDVIIIDEASQADLMALTAVYLGQQVVVVGDHEQVSPLAVGQRVEDAQRLIDEHLQGIPNAILYDGQASIYDVAQRSFDPVCLREHFRCVAPIIEFSNRLAYDGKIKPLRDASRVRLRPHTVAYRVEGASSNEKVNEQEALEVASLLVAATEQPEYAGASFGVISLVGDDQAGRIEALLHRHLSESDYQRRRIQCGNAAQFQGDERDVMFLSMVQPPTGGPLSLIDRDRKQYRQRFNVAASRARDQMWLVHSLDPDVDLKPGDLRRRLIEHARDPEAIKRTLEAGEQQTESELEQRVLRRLVQAGYRVKTQWPVGAYRLDLVVEGNNRRLAIECDGDRYHSREKLAEDMGRQAILERLGWRFARIRGSEFFRNPEQTMESIFARLREMDIPPEGAQAAESAVDEAAEELKQRIIRRAAELRRQWAEQGEEALSYSGTLAASSRQRWGQPEPAQKPAPTMLTQSMPASPAALVQSAKSAIGTPIYQTPKEPPASTSVPSGSAAPPANPPPVQSSAKGVEQSKSQRFFRGDIVKHPAFGIGTVLSSALAAGTEFVRIDFKGQVRIRSINAETAHLEKVQAGTPVAQPAANDEAATLTDTKGPKQTFAVGDQVRHPTYGTGTVIRGSAAFSNYRGDFVQVDFGRQYGKKYLDLQKDSLEKISPAPPPAQPKTNSHPMTGSAQAPNQASHISQTTTSNQQESNPFSAPAQKPIHRFLAGEYVKHPIYGIGKVVSDGDTAIEADFGGQIGKRTLFPEKAHLEKMQGAASASPNMARQNPSGGATSLSAFLREKGLTIIDHRPVGGALWVLGGRELEPLMQDLARKGIKFTFSPNGSKATGYKSAWWYNR